MEETITVRLPGKLKEQVEAAARVRGMTLTGWVKKALEESLLPPYRVVQIPGLDPSFDSFVERLKAEKKPARVLILVDEGHGNRFVCQGYLDTNRTSDSVVVLNDRFTGPAVVLRYTIVGWYDADRDTSSILDGLEQLGWRVLPQRRR